MDIFVNHCNQISNVTKPLFFKFNESCFVQSEPYDRPDNYFIRSSPKSSPKTSPESSPTPSPEKPITKKKETKTESIKTNSIGKGTFCKNDTIILKNISHIFFNIINPIGNKDDDIEAFCKTLDKYKYLLKTITSRHNQLRKQISDYVCSKNSDCLDMYHLNKSYMTFWSKLLNYDIYIISSKTSQYQKFLNSNQNRFIVIKFIEQEGYELINTFETTFVEFNKKFNYTPWIDLSKLSSYSMKELQEICDLHDIRVEIKNKKKDIIQLIKERFD
jgi:Mg2+ and Co2+ transporter CorA